VFIEEYLADLRRERFRPGAVARYLHRALTRSRTALVANPGAVRSVWLLALVYFALAFVASSALALAFDRHVALEFFVATSATLVLAFGLVTLHLDLLRDRDGYRLSALNVPTALTLLRVALLPGIVLFLAEGAYALALGGFLLAAATDVADGWLARRWHQTTPLGTVLDPLVDIVLHLAMFAGLNAAGALPPWVLALAIARYGVLLVGGAYLYLCVGPVRIHSTAFGRTTGVVMAGLIGLLMVLHHVGRPIADRLLPLTEHAIGALLAAAVVQAVAIGWYNLKVMSGAEARTGRVVGDVRWGA
jgi:cardiolipin synthase